MSLLLHCSYCIFFTKPKLWLWLFNYYLVLRKLLILRKLCLKSHILIHASLTQNKYLGSSLVSASIWKCGHGTCFSVMVLTVSRTESLEFPVWTHTFPTYIQEFCQFSSPWYYSGTISLYWSQNPLWQLFLQNTGTIKKSVSWAPSS